MLPLPQHIAIASNDATDMHVNASSTKHVLLHRICSTWLARILPCILLSMSSCCIAQAQNNPLADAKVYMTDSTARIDSTSVNKSDSSVVADTAAQRLPQFDSSFVLHAEEAEQQVALDSAGRIMMLNAQDVERTGLFPNIAQLQEVRLFRRNDSSYVMEFMCLNNQTLSRMRQNMSAAQLQQFRQQFKNAMQNDSTKVLNQEGRPSFVANSLLFSLIYYGPAMSILVNSNDFSSAALSYMVGGIGGVLIPMVATRNNDVTHGMACLSRISGELGIVGASVGYALLDYSRTDIQALAASGILGGLTGTLLGLQVAKTANVSEGRAVAFGSLCVDGMVMSYGLLQGAGVHDQMSDRNALATQYALGAASMLGAWHISSLQDFTAADAHIMAMPSALGALVAVSIYSPTIDFSKNSNVLVATLGYAAGSVSGWYLVKNRSFRTEHYAYTYLSALAGALIGAALGIGANDHEVSTVAATTGAALGFGISALICSQDHGVSLAENSDERSERSLDLAADLSPDRSQGKTAALAAQLKSKSSTDLSFNIHPESLMRSKSSANAQHAPFASLTLKF